MCTTRKVKAGRQVLGVLDCFGRKRGVNRAAVTTTQLFFSSCTLYYIMHRSIGAAERERRRAIASFIFDYASELRGPTFTYASEGC